MDDRGYLRMAGRLKEMIVSGGENIFPVEIENALARPSRRRPGGGGGGARRPLGRGGGGRGGPRGGSAPRTQPTSRRSCGARLAAFKVPRRWVFVDDLPRTASGKVQKHVVRDQLAARQ